MFGFFSTPAFDPTKDIRDLSGQVVLVTGGNAGMGYQIVEQLALHNATVWMGARSEDRARSAISEILTNHPHLPKDQIKWLPLDLSSLAATKKAAQTFLDSNTRLDALVLNAAVMMQPFKPSPLNGVDESMLVNHISHFSLTTDLLPLLERTSLLLNSDVRIVTVSASGHTFPPQGVKFDTYEDLNREFGYRSQQYGYTKLANILFAKELHKRLSESRIISISLHPGVVATQGALSLLPSFLRPLVNSLPFLKSPLDGALNALFAVGSPQVRKEEQQYNGAYIDPVGKIVAPSQDAQDPDLARKLWSTTEEAIKTLLAVENERGEK